MVLPIVIKGTEVSNNKLRASTVSKTGKIVHLKVDW